MVLQDALTFLSFWHDCCLIIGRLAKKERIVAKAALIVPNGIAQAYQSMKIRTKLLVVLIPSIIFIMALTGYVTNWFAGQFLSEAVQRTVILNTLGVAHALGSQFDRTIKDIQFLSKSIKNVEKITSHIRELNVVEDFAYTEFLFFPLNSKLDINTFYCIFTEQNNVISLTTKEIENISPDPFNICLRYISNELIDDVKIDIVEFRYHTNSEGKEKIKTIPVARVYKPIVTEDGEKYLIMLSFPLKVIRNILSIYNSEKSPLHAYARSPEPRYMYFFDHEGWILCQSQDPNKLDAPLTIDLARTGLSGHFSRPFVPWAFMPDSTNEEYWKMLKDIQNGRHGVYESLQPLSDSSLKKCFIGYAPVSLRTSSSVVGGVVFVDRSRLEMFAGYKQIDVMFILTILGALLASLIIFLVSRAITNPILGLAKAVDGIHNLNDLSPIDIKELDYETSMLKNSINNLLDTIQRQFKEIEVRDRQIIKQSMMEKVNLENITKEGLGEETIPEIIGSSAAIRRVKEEIIRAAGVDVDILITGETGTGKQLVAEAIHRLSKRANKPFVSINCGALEETLLLDALFGHIKGAFTEAKSDRKGAFLSAHEGTLFLDEIASASTKVQQALLRALSTRKIRPLGSDEELDVDVRVIAATNQDLRQLVEEGRFREDLFYRLNVISINILPLRERKEDLPLLIQAFFNRFKEELGKQGLSISQGAYSLLLAHNWPGNVRELEHCIKRAVAMAKDRIVLPEDLNLGYENQEEFPNQGPGVLLELPKLNQRQKALIDFLLKEKSIITRAEYQRLSNRLPPRTAAYDLQHLVTLGLLEKIGKGPATRYRLKTVSNNQN